MAKRKKPRLRKEELNLKAIQIGTDKFIRKYMPWITRPSISHKPLKKRVHREKDLFISR